MVRKISNFYPLSKKAKIYENDVIESLKKGEYDIIGISVAQDRVLGVQKMIADLELIFKMRKAAEVNGKIPMFVSGGQAAQLNYKQWLDLSFLGMFLLIQHLEILINTYHITYDLKGLQNDDLKDLTEDVKNTYYG